MRIVESNFLLHTGPPKNQTIHLRELSSNVQSNGVEKSRIVQFERCYKIKSNFLIISGLTKNLKPEKTSVLSGNASLSTFNIFSTTWSLGTSHSCAQHALWLQLPWFGISGRTTKVPPVQRMAGMISVSSPNLYGGTTLYQVIFGCCVCIWKCLLSFIHEMYSIRYSSDRWAPVPFCKHK